MSTSDRVLRTKVDKVIKKLEEPLEVECKAHGPLAEGVKVLLEIQREVLNAREGNQNSIKVGALTVNGGLAVTVVALIWYLLENKP